MAKIYTKTGDGGKTSLIGGTRVPKFDIRVETYGVVDELNSNLGLLDTDLLDETTKEVIFHIQHRLFNVGAVLATDQHKFPIPEKIKIKPEDIAQLESAIDALQEKLPLFNRFILPRGNRSAALAHVCRTICRRAERMIYRYEELYPVDDAIKVYMNRLSDYLFLVARNECFIAGIEKIYWEEE